jgi:hypothetical protein
MEKYKLGNRVAKRRMSMKKAEWGVVALVLMIAPLSYVLGGTQGGTGGTQGTTHAGPTANHGAANAGARPTTTPTKPNVAALIAELERNRAVGVVKGDVAKLEMETANDAIFIDRNGKVRDKMQTMSAIKSGDIKLMSNELSGLQVRVYGDTAVIVGKTLFHKGEHPRFPSSESSLRNDV